MEHADVVLDIPEVGRFFFWRLNILASIYFVHTPPLVPDSLMALRRAKKVMLNAFDGMLCYCAIYYDDAKAIRFAEWLGFRGTHEKEGMLVMKRES